MVWAMRGVLSAITSVITRYQTRSRRLNPSTTDWLVAEYVVVHSCTNVTSTTSMKTDRTRTSRSYIKDPIKRPRAIATYLRITPPPPDGLAHPLHRSLARFENMEFQLELASDK